MGMFSDMVTIGHSGHSKAWPVPGNESKWYSDAPSTLTHALVITGHYFKKFTFFSKFDL